MRDRSQINENINKKTKTRYIVMLNLMFAFIDIVSD